MIDEHDLRRVEEHVVEARRLVQRQKLLEDKIQALGVGHMFEVLGDRIITPGNGVIVFQGMQDASAESIKSFENFRIGWGEEAQT